MTGPDDVDRAATASLWAWRLALVSTILAGAATVIAILSRITGGGRGLSSLPALSIPVVVVGGMAALVVGTVALRWSTSDIEELPELTDQEDGPWRSWRRSIRAVALGGALVLAGPFLLLMVYASM